jgi:Asp-tRNA(Asn)/Glu-tRNA(Gln) amidotransferase A subunit family amidase
VCSCFSGVRRLQSGVAAEIVRRITDGQWTAAHVLEAYIARAAQAHAATNCITEVMFATARVRARELDEAFARTGQVQGLLHGVPMSLKDQCT